MSESHLDWQSGKLRVVVNDEGQYSVWPVERDLPNGWREAGLQGNKEECLEYINRVWTDMRPLSLREQMLKQT